MDTIQLRLLRETIPSLMRTMHGGHRSREDLYTAISQSAVGAVASVKGFTARIKDLESQHILLKANESRAKNNEGVVDWLVTQHPNWLDRTVENGVKELKFDEQDGFEGDIADQVSLQDATEILNKFQDEHPRVDISMDQEAQALNVCRVHGLYTSSSC